MNRIHKYPSFQNFRNCKLPSIFLFVVLFIHTSSEAVIEKADSFKLWATIDNNTETVLTFLNPGPTYKDKYEDQQWHCKYEPAWSQIQDGAVSEYREPWHLIVNRSEPNSPEWANKFPPLIFYHFCSLFHFDMVNQHLKYIEAADFEQAEKLTSLNLSHNEIVRIETNTFGNANKLETIDLSYNSIEFIDYSAFDVTELKWLHLHHNKLSDVKWELFYQRVIKGFTLTDNYNLVIYTEDYSVRTFDVSNNLLENKTVAIPVKSDEIIIRNIGILSVTIFPLVTKLEAPNNQIAKIVLEDADQEFQLKTLNLANNQLTNISELSKFRNAEVIDLSFNHLETFDARTFVHMNNLRVISFSHNNLKNVEFGFVLNTFKLEILDVSYNELGSFVLDGIFPSLKELYIEGNNLTVLDPFLTRSAPKLTRTGLNDNRWDCKLLVRTLQTLQVKPSILVFRASTAQNVPVKEYTGAVLGVSCFVENAKLKQKHTAKGEKNDSISSKEDSSE